MKVFSGEVVLVTGAASGIGAALAEQLTRHGARVYRADKNGAGEILALDVTDGVAFRRAVEAIIEKEGRLDALFNNAGIGLAGPAEELTLEDWRRIVEVDLIGVMNGIAAAYPHMVRAKKGRIVNTASGAGLAPRPGMTAYAAAKHGVIGLSVSLRAEAALFGVEVTAICPGYVATRIMDSSKMINLDANKLKEKIPIAPMTAERCAELALRGVAKNQAIVAISAYVKLDWYLYRVSPALSAWIARWRARTMRKSLLTAMKT